MSGKNKLSPVPEVGKFYHFWDDGKTGPSRHYLCKVEELITPQQAKEIILEENCIEEYPLSLYDIWRYQYGSQYCSAPTQQMARSWLYEEKGIYIAVLPCEKGFHAMIYHTVVHHLEYIGLVSDKEHDNPTHQQTIEAALQYVLINLI